MTVDPVAAGLPYDVGRVEGVTYLVDPSDPRLDDYRELNSIAVRAEMERDEYFLGEGYVPIDRMLDSGHRMRSVLLHPKRLKRFVPTMARPEMAGVPVYVAEQAVLAEVVGFNMDRCCLASAFRRRPGEHVPAAGRARRAERRSERGCDRSRFTGVRHRRHGHQPDLQRSVSTAHGAGEHG